MNKKDEKDFYKLMAMLCEIYNCECSSLKVEIYFRALEEYTIDQLKTAISELIKKRQYQSFPKPAEIIALLSNEDNFEDIAQEQFLIAKDTITSHGAYRSVQFDDPIIHKVIESMGGWVNFCMTQLTDWTWKEKEFIKYYVSYRSLNADGKLELPRYLQGLSPTAKVSEVKTYHPSAKKGESIEDKSNETLKKLFHDIRTKKENDNEKNK